MQLVSILVKNCVSYIRKHIIWISRFVDSIMFMDHTKLSKVIGTAVIGIWRRQIENGEPITIVGDGEQKRDFTHVYDIVDALLELQSVNSSLSIIDAWELGTGINYSINEVADMFVKYGGASKEYIADQDGNYRETLENLMKHLIY